MAGIPWNKGLTKETDERIKNQSMKLKGRKVSDETKKKQSKVKSGEKHPMFGKKHSDVTKKKMSNAHKGKVFSEEHKKRLSDNHADFSGENHPMYGKPKQGLKGKNNPMFGRCAYDIWLKKYGLKEAEKLKKETSLKLKEKWKKREPFSTQTKKKMRLSAIKRIEKSKFNAGQLKPNYNPDGCKIIDAYGKKNGYNFQHAENGGEICIDGYFPDGVDEKRKTIIEIDEKHHFDVNGNLRQKDIDRQKYILRLGYKIIRVKINEFN